MQILDMESTAPTKEVLKHRNGLTKVATEGKSLELAQQNREQSPLLRLPPEIRDEIFKYALTNKTIQIPIPRRVFFKPQGVHPKNCFALLRVSRQIYHETVHLPYSNCFSFPQYTDIHPWVEKLLPCHREQIETIELQICSWLGPNYPFELLCRSAYLFNMETSRVIRVLPALKNIVLTARYPAWFTAEQQKEEDQRLIWRFRQSNCASKDIIVRHEG